MTGHKHNVKFTAGFIGWVDRNPRTGWYLFVLILANYLLDLLTAVW